jgi:hypothetical protein
MPHSGSYSARNGSVCAGVPYRNFLLVPEFHTGTYICLSGNGLDNRAIEVRSPAEAKRIFPLASVSRPAMGPTQPPVQCTGGKARPIYCWGRERVGVMPPHPPAPPKVCRGTDLLYFTYIYHIHLFFPLFWRYMLVSLLRRILALLNFHFKHWVAVRGLGLTQRFMQIMPSVFSLSSHNGTRLFVLFPLIQIKII